MARNVFVNEGDSVDLCVSKIGSTDQVIRVTIDIVGSADPAGEAPYTGGVSHMMDT